MYVIKLMKQIYFKAVYLELITILGGFLPSEIYNFIVKYPKIATKLFDFNIFYTAKFLCKNIEINYLKKAKLSD